MRIIDSFRIAMLLSIVSVVACGAESIFKDDFKNHLADGWWWIREDRSGWRVTEEGLVVRIQPGNMWGPANNATNVLTRPLPETAGGEVEISVTVENRPTGQYEQADLVWYYDDSNMVKLGQELVDGKLSIVMGREENDRTRTMAILPLESSKVQLRLIVKDRQIRGEYRPAGQEKWIPVGETDLPVKGQPKASLQVYQGPKAVEHWARFTEFRILQRGE